MSAPPATPEDESRRGVQYTERSEADRKLAVLYDPTNDDAWLQSTHAVVPER